MTQPACIECGQVIAAVTAHVDAQTIEHRFVTGCGHDLDADLARDLWRRGYRWDQPAIDGPALIGAERVRQVIVEGYSPEHDAEHDDALPWAAWAYIDAAMHPTSDGGPPAAWPWPVEAWNAEASPLRRLVIAGALVAAEIDRRLLAARGKGEA
jgi:hypothetical protein